MELMRTLDDAWNAQDLETFAQRHKPDVVVRWPGRPPTHGRPDHRQEAVDFLTAFPDQHVDNRPYKVFSSGDWDLLDRAFRADLYRTDVGPRRQGGPAHREVVRGRHLHGCQWHDEQIVEENLFYDPVTFMKQIGLGE